MKFGSYRRTCSLGSSVCTVTRLRAGQPRNGCSLVGRGHPDRLCSPPCLLFTRYRGRFSRGVKRPDLEADDSPRCSAEVELCFHFPVCLHDVHDEHFTVSFYQNVPSVGWQFVVLMSTKYPRFTGVTLRGEREREREREREGVYCTATLSVC